jgi:hypothetical protein
MGSITRSAFWTNLFRGERRIANPLSTEELTRAIVGLASGEKDAVRAVARLVASAVQRLVAER